MLLFTGSILSGCAGFMDGGSKAEAPVTGEDFVLDTICGISIYGMDEKRADGVIKDTFEECRRYEGLLSKTIKTSDIYKINHAGGKAVKVHPDTLAAVKAGKRFGKLGGGSFDITIGGVMDLWEFHEDADSGGSGGSGKGAGEAEYGAPPDAKTAKEAARHVDQKELIIDGSAIKLKDPAAKIDLGGMAKGWISDRLAEFMKERGVTSAIISLGGNVVCIGGKPDGSDFDIGIKDPFAKLALLESGADKSNGTNGTGGKQGAPETEDGLADRVKVSDAAVVTSGTYERAVEYKGKTYHHIIDPKTGYPAKAKLASVTVVMPAASDAKDGGEKAAAADALATICILTGEKDPSRGALKRVIKNFKKEYGSFELILIDEDGRVAKRAC